MLKVPITLVLKSIKGSFIDFIIATGQQDGIHNLERV